MIRSKLVAILSLSTALTAVGPALADPLTDGFVSPPNAARPRLWWHWMNGNISEDGLVRDLAWMKRVGIGGTQIVDVSLGAPKVVPETVLYGSPQWKSAMGLAIREGNKDGLEMGVGIAPGWSGTGGPWVKAEDGMKKLVWSETSVDGGTPFTGRLAAPPDATGPYQDVHTVPVTGPGEKPPVLPTYYRDVATIAYPDDGGDALVLPASGDATGQVISLTPLAAQESHTVDIPVGDGKADPTFAVHYEQPQTLRSVTIGFAPGGMFTPFLYTVHFQAKGADGTWTTVAEVPYHDGVPTTVSFSAVTGQNFRLLLSKPNFPAGGFGGSGFAPKLGPAKLSVFKLYAAPRVNLSELKAGFGVVPDYYNLPAVADGATGVPKSQIIDLTGRVRPDGTLDWTPPAGRWKVIRFGYSLVGTVNHPASSEATGLEVDKLDRASVHNFMTGFLQTQETYAKLGKGGLATVINDSIESGPANWTPKMREQFQRLRGYDLTPWLPALTGEIIDSREATDKFLYDFRRTITELTATEHYAQVAADAKASGIRLYSEALEGGRPSLGDDLAMRRYADVPMGALWTWLDGNAPTDAAFADLRGAASVAHLYGKPLVSAESMTSTGAPWGMAPKDLKKVIDLEFALGVNQPIIHESVHVAAEDKLPGISLMDVGIYFNRNETWAEMAKPWLDYIARTSYMMQQGQPVTDLAYFIGEEGPLTALFQRQQDTAAPKSYGFDYVGPGELADQLSVQNGKIVSKGGAQYQALYLGGSSRFMTIAALNRIAALAKAGATIIGTKPVASPSLSDDPQAFKALADQLWSGAASAVGKGRIIDAPDGETGLKTAGIAPDLSLGGVSVPDTVIWRHRHVVDGEIYYLVNRTDKTIETDASFRTAGHPASVWRAEDGRQMPLSFTSDGSRTTSHLTFAPHESKIIVFRGKSAAKQVTVPVQETRTIAQVSGSWTVSFQANRGAPASVVLPELKSLTESTDDGVKYFSGTAVYATDLSLEALPSGAVSLDLGQVGDLAEVTVNGQPVGAVWHAPYVVTLKDTAHGGPLKAGTNHIEVKVATLWKNRLIGDQQPGAKKITFTTMPFYRANSPLRPSGLIGPVTLQVTAPKP